MSPVFETASEQQTGLAGAMLGRLARPGDVVALAGDLGAGKTHLVQGMAEGLGVAEPVTSPTFNLLVVHPGPVPLYHFDLYRLERERDLEDIAFWEMLEGDGVSAIEWGDRFPGALPEDHLLVTIHRTGEDSRRFEVTATGDRSRELADAWAAGWAERAR